MWSRGSSSFAHSASGSSASYTVCRKPAALPFFGDLLRGRENHVALFEDCMRLEADIVEVNLCTRSGFVLVHPEAVREALVLDNDWLVRRNNLETAAIEAFLGRGVLTTDGDTWLAFKRLNAPAFARTAIEGMQRLVEDSVDRSFAEWLPNGSAQRPLFHDFMALAATATTTGFLSLRPDKAEQNELCDALLEGPEVIIDMIRYRSPWILRLPLPRMKRMRRIMAAIDRLIEKNAARRKPPGNRDEADLLDLVLQYRHPQTDALLGPAEVRDQMFSAIIAAPENIATTLSWATFALQSAPAVLDKLRDSLARGETKYLRAVIDETMRRFASTPIVDRTAARDGVLGRVNIPRGSLVVVPILGLHNHPRYWESPEQFRPERFLDTPVPRAYFPFGHGPRKCIGERLGRTVLEMALRKFVTLFDWSRPTPVEPGVTPLVNLRPRDGMQMRLERRAEANLPDARGTYSSAPTS